MNPNTTAHLSSSHQKIANAVETAFKACQGGADPNLEIAKAASDLGLTVDQAKRAAETLNVVSTLGHLKAASGDQRTASFAIADPVKVAKIMFPDGLPAAQRVDTEKQAFAGTEYDLGTYDDGIPNPDLISPAQLNAVTPAMVCSKIAAVSGYADSLSSEMQNRCSESIAAIETNFRKMASLTEGLYGASVAGIRDEVLRDAVAHMVTKAAASRPPVGSVELDGLAEQTQLLMKQAARLEAAVADIDAGLQDFRKQAELGVRELQELGPEAYRPLLGMPLTDPITGAITRGLISKNLPKTLENFDYNPYNDPQLRSVEDTRAMLRNLVTLTRLMKDDPVLSKADPKTVTDAFNSMFSTMPGFFENPELARAALRHHVEYGGVDFPTMITAMTGQSKLQPTGMAAIQLRADDYSTKSREAKSKFQDSLRASRQATDAERKSIRAQQQQHKAAPKTDAKPGDTKGSKPQGGSPDEDKQGDREIYLGHAKKLGVGEGWSVDSPGVRKAIDTAVGKAINEEIGGKSKKT